MICVTGCERTPDELRDRQRRAAGADLHELRLDLLADPAVPVEALAAGDSLAKLVITCRPARAGGGFGGDEARRLELLRRAADAGAGFVDVESDVSPAAADVVLGAAARGRTRVIRSLHVLEAPAAAHRETAARMDELRTLRGHVLKLAVAVGDAADLEPLRRLGRRRDRPVVLVGLGAAGVLSRVCHRRFGSAWSYVAADEANRTAPGQLTWATAREWRLCGGDDPAPVALLGGPQVHGSPGPEVYNGLFARRGVPWVYLPVETARLAETWALLRELGARAASVTMPHKRDALALVDALGESAAAVGAINTIHDDHGVRSGANTDGVGAARALAAVGPLRGAAVLVLGAGATARAVALALAGEGANVGVWNRTAAKARALAADLAAARPGTRIEAVERIGGSFDVLVNATSVGLGGAGCPWDDRSSLSGKVVLDCVAQPPRTPLIALAAAAGATTVTGLEMWLHQGAAQASLWLGEPVGAEELRALLPERLRAAGDVG